ncbi:MAG: hypothetical protein MZV65_18150 [Chromatiales bacterium]|nr:hypothetical protein [Chromatiales bacterium]
MSSLVWNTQGLRETLASSTELSAEFLDYPRFDGESYIRALALFLNEKYALRPPTVLVVGGEEALGFLLRHRAELFPQVPVVHAAVARSFLSSLPPLPADVVGVPIEYDFPGTIDLALRWHPRARRLVGGDGGIRPRTKPGKPSCAAGSRGSRTGRRSSFSPVCRPARCWTG